MTVDTFLVIHKEAPLFAIQSETSPLTSSFMEKLCNGLEKHVNPTFKIGQFTFPDGKSDKEEWTVDFTHQGNPDKLRLLKIEVIKVTIYHFTPNNI